MSDKFSGVKEVRCIQGNIYEGFNEGEIYSVSSVLCVHLKVVSNSGIVRTVFKGFFEPVTPEPKVTVKLPSLSFKHTGLDVVCMLPSLEVHHEGFINDETLLEDIRASLKETFQNSIKKETLRRSKQEELKKLQKEVDKAKTEWDDALQKLKEAKENT